MNPLSPVQIWSAAPTPLTADLKVDISSVEKMVADSLRIGIAGLFLAGTCGEGAWLPEGEKRRLIKAAVAASGGKLKIAAQVSDNSVPRILDNVAAAADAGADYAIIAAPTFMLNDTPERIVGIFEEAANASTLPVGIYDLGKHRSICIPEEMLENLYLLPNVKLVKDSSASPTRQKIALEALKKKPTLVLFNGDEFECLPYLEAGYTGCMFGGAAVIATEARKIIDLYQAGKLSEAKAADGAMKEMLYGVYGGKSFECWLTGLKYYMVRRGLFSTTASYLEYPLTASCRAYIEQLALTKG